GFCNGAPARVHRGWPETGASREAVGGLREVRHVRLVDASGVALQSPQPPRRIVSLIPSTTETLCALGLADALVGITVYCREPAVLLRGKTRFGGGEGPRPPTNPPPRPPPLPATT